MSYLQPLKNLLIFIKGLSNILNYKNYEISLCKKIINKLIGINLKERPSTNLKVMTTDIVNILMQIQKKIHFKEIVIYLNKSLEEEIIDKKLKKEIQELLN